MATDRLSQAYREGYWRGRNGQDKDTRGLTTAERDMYLQGFAYGRKEWS